MLLAPGTRLGPYEIVALIGSGGMGEVYKAKDTRLERVVALKISKMEFSERFEREARAVAALNHSNICTLYDVGPNYLVMEYIEGKPLKGPMPVDQALKYATQICDALDAAHKKAITHRDLKPDNILLTKTGIKLLDFGLAKTARATASPVDATFNMTLTGNNEIVGTLYYMSPEQLQGSTREIDARSDIFSFGLVFYEMLTGKRAFDGSSPASVIAAIMERPAPSITDIAPRALDRALQRCLAKDAGDRWQSARDLKAELEWIGEADSGSGVPAQVVRKDDFRKHLGWVVASVFLLACVALAIAFLGRTEQHAGMVRSSLLPPAGSSFLPYNFAIAPDGSRLAFVTLGSDGKTALWVRGLSSPNSQQLTGTEGAAFPFWSPDSLHVGFFAQGRLKTIDLVNSAVQSICDGGAGFGGTWNQDGVIVFAPGISGPLYRVSAAGGTPELVTKVSQTSSGESHHWPLFLPDGKHFLYVVNWRGSSDAQHNGLYVASLDSDTPRLVSPDIIGNVFFASGHLLYVRDRTIIAQPFNSSRLQTTGPGVPVTQPEVDRFFDFWQSGFSVSQDGKLIFQSAADAPSRLVWYDAVGKELGQLPEIGYSGPQFSPDGGSLAVYSDDEHNGRHFIRVYDLRRGISTRLTEGGNESNPVWSPDGRSIAFRDASLNIREVAADGSGPPQLLVKGTNVIPCDWSVDGRLIYMSVDGGEPFPSLDVYSFSDRKSTQVLRFGAEPQFSPDGKWVAYIELPTRQIVVQRFPGTGAHLQVSNVPGSAQPRWSHDGRRLFFVQPDRKLMVVDFDPSRIFASPPQLFFQTRIEVTIFGWFQYDVSPDGRVLVNSLPANSSPLTLVTGWDKPLSHP